MGVRSDMRGKLPLLLVEDSDEDFFITKRILEKAGFENPVIRCQTGDEALDYLFRRGMFADPRTSPRPGLILLDLNLPGTDGREVLQEIKSHERFRLIPVVVLTTSDAARDVERCYSAGVNSYIHKSLDMNHYARSLERLATYWLEVVLLPERETA